MGQVGAPAQAAPAMTKGDMMADTVSDAAQAAKTGANAQSSAGGGKNKDEAKSHFNAAVEEAKAGAAALGAEAKDRAAAYKGQAKDKGDEWSTEARAKAGELARDGKSKASGALSSLSRTVADNAPAIDEKLGERYGDYARTASKSLQDTAEKLDSKSVEELGEDAREFVRKSPGTAVGLAALAGFLIARVLRK